MMSLAELLPAIRALPKDEQVQLLHLLVDDVVSAKPTGAEVAALAALLPTGGAYDVPTPPDGYEAAAILQQLLQAQQDRK